jgi:hypothetical protein
MRNFLLAALFLLLPLIGTAAEDFAYVYIQGDKQTPFYVKLEEGMQPRYGKNYCILSRLAPGPAHIEILFQQNAFPPQQFTIQVPERGSREFMIVQRDGVFNLYDIQQKFYLAAGNKIGDDHAPATMTAATTQTPAQHPSESKPARTKQAEQVASGNEPSAWDNGVKKAAVVLAKGRDKSKELAQKAVQPLQPKAATDAGSAATTTDGKPQFINDMELSTPNSTSGNVSNGTTQRNTKTGTVPPPIANSDCPNAIGASEFGKVFNGLSAYGTDEEKVEYFGKQLDKCYETWQARTLAGKLEGDAARFELLRKIYPRITDQAAFPLLDDLLSTPSWKDAFNRLVHR